jgi:serine O-acetyltransferase
MAESNPTDIRQASPDSSGCEMFPRPSVELRNRLGLAVESLAQSCRREDLVNHVDGPPIPSTESIDRIICLLRNLLYPGYFGEQELDHESLVYHLGSGAKELFNALSFQIACSLRQICQESKRLCVQCIHNGQQYAMRLLERLPALRELLAGDVRAHYDGDPAAKSLDEIVFCYPGLYAITVYRAAHELWQMEVPLLPRIMTEHAHGRTGIDIHPGAKIGRHFFIDHGTGVVIGETTEIGDNVRIYQGVTLGALSFPTDEHGNIMRGHKRHPTIEDNVTIYSGATILGGETTIGENSVIGGNVWITSSVPPNTTVLMAAPKLQFREDGGRRPGHR